MTRENVVKLLVFVAAAREVFAAQADPEHIAHNKTNWAELRDTFQAVIDEIKPLIFVPAYSLKSLDTGEHFEIQRTDEESD